MTAETFWSVSATRNKDDERWAWSGTKAECRALLKLKLKEWGVGETGAHIEWSEHPMPVYLDDEWE